MGNEVHADVIGDAARRDRQLSVPRLPVLRIGVRLREAGDVVVLDGADRPQVFTGRFAREMLATLAALCDGTRDHAAIATELGLPEEAVHKAVTLMWSVGALEEHRPGGAGGGLPPELICALSRLGNSTGTNASWADAAERLASRTVTLVGDTALVAATRELLSGVCSLRDDPASGDAAGGDLVVAFSTGGDDGLAERARRWWREGRPLLLVRADARTAAVGPVIDRSFSPCLECVLSGAGNLGGEVPRHSVDLVAGMAGHHVVALLSRSWATFLPLDVCEIDLTTLRTAYRSPATRPGCPSCSFVSGPVAPKAPDSAVYEAAVALPPYDYFDPKGLRGHYHASNIRLPFEFRSWPSATRFELPPVEMDRLSAGPPEQDTGMSGGDLSVILKMGFGIRDETLTADRVARWTASAANIGSAIAYVVSRDESILPEGVYAYVDRDHQLARITREVVPGKGRVGLVVTANLSKSVKKYGAFGLRLCWLDAGCALSTVRAVCRGLGVPYRPVPDWDDGVLHEVLGTSPAREPVAAVMELGMRS
ncbi:tpaE [Sphaerisporangium fuscum]|uniref:tpaE n=1 Tax=Sphaerisporangium fuscum TaxID=2835868 RepID=UPI001BDBC632|nr:tpaE [Sphaerisporangium fuscum]